MKKENIRSLSFILAAVLMLGSVIGGTVAWLIATPDPVVNTFTYGDIDITLTETDTKLDADDNDKTNTYKMMPGQLIAKDPKITVVKGSEEMWLFVKLEKSENFDTFMEYTVDGNWVALDETNHPGVYYRHITAAEIKDNDLECTVLAGNAVKVKDTVTKAMLNGLDENADGTQADTKYYPTLTVKAYAVQHAGNDTAADAWAKVLANP